MLDAHSLRPGQRTANKFEGLLSSTLALHHRHLHMRAVSLRFGDYTARADSDPVLIFSHLSTAQSWISGLREYEPCVACRTFVVPCLEDQAENGVTIETRKRSGATRKQLVKPTGKDLDELQTLNYLFTADALQVWCLAREL